MLLLQPDTLRASALAASIVRESEAVKQQSPVLMRNRGRLCGGGAEASGTAGGRCSFELCRCKLPLLGITLARKEARNGKFNVFLRSWLYTELQRAAAGGEGCVCGLFAAAAVGRREGEWGN
jgi:hypothetical protein